MRVGVGGAVEVGDCVAVALGEAEGEEEVVGVALEQPLALENAVEEEECVECAESVGSPLAVGVGVRVLGPVGLEDLVMPGERETLALGVSGAEMLGEREAEEEGVGVESPVAGGVAVPLAELKWERVEEGDSVLKPAVPVGVLAKEGVGSKDAEAAEDCVAAAVPVGCRGEAEGARGVAVAARGLEGVPGAVAVALGGEVGAPEAVGEAVAPTTP